MSKPAAVSDPDWVDHAIDAIERLAKDHSVVTSEDLRRVHEPPEHANQYGTAFRTAKARHVITPTGIYRPSSERSRRGGTVQEWVLHPSRKRKDQP